MSRSDLCYIWTMDGLAEYHAMVMKVQAFVDEVAEEGKVACRPGCMDCCKVHLTITEVEAAALRRHLLWGPREVRDDIARRATHSAHSDLCVMLAEDGTCQIYPARPLICRTQGLTLRYPEDSCAPETDQQGDFAIACCEKNLHDGQPMSHRVVDAYRIDQLLGLVNYRFCQGSKKDPLGRVPLHLLGKELGSPR